MNELENYKQALSKKFWDDNHNTEQRAVIQGFDAAIALDLPVKFAKFYNIPSKKEIDKILLHFGYIPNVEELHQYWLDNVLKLK